MTKVITGIHPNPRQLLELKIIIKSQGKIKGQQDGNPGESHGGSKHTWPGQRKRTIHRTGLPDMGVTSRSLQ